MKSKFARFSPEWWEWMTMPEPNTGCLLWTGNVCKSGYGRVAYSPNGSPVLVHRIALGQALGHPISSGVKVLHRCDTPSCVNPDHLYLGTQKDNMRDMFAKGRARPHGSGKRRLQLTSNAMSATVAVRELASEDSHASVIIADGLHHIRTTAMVAGWRHVTGVPARRPTTAIVLANRPQDGTQKPSTPRDHRLAAVATVALCCALASGCVSETPLGKCIGLNGDADSTLVYKYNAGNLALGALGFELIYPPIKVALDELQCPVARRKSPAERTPERAR